MKTIIFGIKVLLDSVFPEHTDLGLFAVPENNSILRWSESKLTGVAETWAPGLIAPGGIGELVQRADLRRGGAVAIVDGTTIKVDNTDQMILKFSELGLYLDGLTVVIEEFTGIDTDSDSVGHRIAFTGAVENVTWDERYIYIKVNSVMTRKRRVDFGNGEVPVTFGRHAQAVAVRTDYQKRLQLSDVPYLYESLATPPSEQEQSLFPVEWTTYGVSAIDLAENTLTTASHFWQTGTRIDITATDESAIPVPLIINRLYYTIRVSDTVIQLAASYENALSGIAIDLTSHNGNFLNWILRPSKILPTNIFTVVCADDGSFGEGRSTGWTEPERAIYVKVTEGARSGQIRRVSRWRYINRRIVFMVENIFEGGNLVETVGSDKSWVNFIESEDRYYYEKSWPTGLPIGEQFFVFKDERYIQIPNIGAEVDSTSGLISVKSESLSNDPSTSTSFILSPVKNIRLATDSSLTAWGIPEAITKQADGIYRSNSFPVTEISLLDIENISDGDPFTFGEITTRAVENSTTFGFLFELPSFPEELVDVEVFLFFKVRDELFYPGTIYVPNNTTIKRGAAKKFFQSAEELFSFSTNNVSLIVASWFDNIPNASPQNERLFYDSPAVGGLYPNRTGYQGFKVNVNSIEKYNQLKQMLFAITRHNPHPVQGEQFAIYNRIRLYDIAVGFKTSFDVKSNIFSSLRGRTFADTWSGPRAYLDETTDWKNIIDIQNAPPSSPAAGDRYIVGPEPTGDWAGQANNLTVYSGSAWGFTVPGYAPDDWGQVALFVVDKAADYTFNGTTWVQERKTRRNLIERPVDVLEHVKRLQNFSNAESPNMGRVYDPNALICTSGPGSFDSTPFQLSGAVVPLVPGDINVSRQLTGEVWTDAVSSELCSSFFLLNYQNNLGEECVSYLFDDSETVEEITFNDIIGSVGKMIEPALADIFCEPYVNYAYDQGSKKYLKQLKITNIGASEWAPEHTVGYNGTDGEETWSLCRQLWLRTRQIEPMPDSLSNRPWIRAYEDAVWYLRKLSEWMGKRRIDFTVSYAKGAEWTIGKKIRLRLLHHTADTSVVCLIEEIRKNKQQAITKIQVVLLTDIPSSFFFE